MSVREDPTRRPPATDAALVPFLLQELRPIHREPGDPEQFDGQAPAYEVQNRLVEEAITRTDSSAYLEDRALGAACFDRTRREVLLEYATMRLARAFALYEEEIYDSGSDIRDNDGTPYNKKPPGPLQFFVHDAGLETAYHAVMRWTDNRDPVFPYYRGTTLHLQRGGSVQTLAAQDFHTEGDEMSQSRQLGGHIGMGWQNIAPASSETGSNIYQAVGKAVGMEIDRTKHSMDGTVEVEHAPIALWFVGEATLRQDQVLGGFAQMADQQAPMVAVVVNNGGGISMDLSTNTIHGSGDPILMMRSLKEAGLLEIVEVDADDTEGMAGAGQYAVDYARSHRKPVLLHIKNVPRITDHTSSSDLRRYMTDTEYRGQMARDPLQSYRDYLLENGVASEDELSAIEQGATRYVHAAVTEVTSRQPEDPKRLYEAVYPAGDRFERVEIAPWYPVDRLYSTRKPGVEYIDHDNLRDGQVLNYRQAILLTIAQEMARDPGLFMIGEDVGMYNRRLWQPGQMNAYLEAKFADAVAKKRYSPDQLGRVKQVMDSVLRRKGWQHEDPQALVDFLLVMEGKGGVFGTSAFLEPLFGPEQCASFPISEAAIVGTAAGQSHRRSGRFISRGRTGIAQIQFDAYEYPAEDQIRLAAHTLWRSAGQFDNGMVLQLQGMNRVGAINEDQAGGAGGIGHGAAHLAQLRIDGWRVCAPSNAVDAQGMMREAIRYAQRGGKVAIFEAINLYRSSTGPYQGPEARVPLGEARVIDPLKGILDPREADEQIAILTHSNNVRIAEAAARRLVTDAGRRIHTTVIDTRGAMGVEFDYDTVGRVLGVDLHYDTSGRPVGKSYRDTGVSKLMTLEAGPGRDTAFYLQNMEVLRDALDAPVHVLHARNIPMSAGAANEAYHVPQIGDVIAMAQQLADY